MMNSWFLVKPNNKLWPIFLATELLLLTFMLGWHIGVKHAQADFPTPIVELHTTGNVTGVADMEYDFYPKGYTQPEAGR